MMRHMGSQKAFRPASSKWIPLHNWSVVHSPFALRSCSLTLTRKTLSKKTCCTSCHAMPSLLGWEIHFALAVKRGRRWIEDEPNLGMHGRLRMDPGGWNPSRSDDVTHVTGVAPLTPDHELWCRRSLGCSEYRWITEEKWRLLQDQNQPWVDKVVEYRWILWVRSSSPGFCWGLNIAYSYHEPWMSFEFCNLLDGTCYQLLMTFENEPMERGVHLWRCWILHITIEDSLHIHF